MLSASVSCADPSWGPGLHRDELRQTGRSPAPAIGQELSLITGSLSDDATPDAIFASTGSLHLLS